MNVYKEIELEENIKFGSFNSRGLNNKLKRQTLFRKFKIDKLDIIAIQESFVASDKVMNNIFSEWRGVVHHSKSSGRSKGLITLFSSKFDANDISNTYLSDRIIISRIKIKSEIIFVINIYAPCLDRDKVQFLDVLSNELAKIWGSNPEANIICLGDFNVTADESDNISGNPHSHDIQLAFKEFRVSNHLIDSWRILNPEVKDFSWSRNSTARRLDYILISSEFSPYLKDSNIASIGFSDHRLVTTTLEFSSFKFGKGLFKLNTSLLRDVNYCNIINKEIKETLNEYKDVSPHARWEAIKINCKEKSQQYGRYKSLHTSNTLSASFSRLKELERHFIMDPKNEEVSNEIVKLKSQIELVEINQAKAAKLRAGIKYIEDGEQCTKYFLSLEKHRSKMNTIKSLRNEDGVLIKNEHDIVNAIGKNFEKRYNKSKSLPYNISNCFDAFTQDIDIPTISNEEADLCDADLSEQEVTNALKSLNHRSAPGSDGLPVEWYIVFWQQIKRPLMECYEYSYISNELSYSERLGVISLFHKGKDLPSDNLDNWRPISLTNTDYKLLTKVFSIRLDKVINSIIGEQQVGFMKGRKISLLHRMLDDLLNLQRRSGNPGILFSIDFKQAFDSLSIQSISKTLHKFGFGPNFIKWIEIFNTNREACVKNGGYLSYRFDMSNGVRQGCPISPQLFILVVEILSRKVIQDELISGLNPHGGSTPLKISQYADDTTLFLKDINELNRAILHLESFSMFSHLFLNLNKSFAISTNGRRVENNINEVKFKDKIKILGIWFSNKTNAGELEDNWTSRIDKILKIFSSWSRRDLSLIGKIQIIKTYGISQLNHVMQSIGIPSKVLEQINRLFFRFLWKKRFNNKKAYEKVKRKVMCNDFQHGGLNMIDIIRTQHSIYLSWVDLLCSSSISPWKELAMFLLKDVGGMLAFKSTVSARNFKGLDLIPSLFWKSVLNTWIEYANHNDDLQIEPNDPLFNNKLITYKHEPLFLPSCIKAGISKISDFLLNGILLTLDQFIEKYGMYSRAILDYNVIHNALKDKTIILEERPQCEYIFKGNPVGNLKRKFYYQSINPQVAPNCPYFWIRKFPNFDLFSWHYRHSFKESRLRILSWKILHNIYPTNILLYKMKIVDSMNCASCKTLDFIEHFFFHCKDVKHLWIHIKKDILVETGTSIDITDEIALLGVGITKDINKTQMKTINLLLAIGRLTVSKFRYGKPRNIIHIYETECYIRSLKMK